MATTTSRSGVSKGKSSSKLSVGHKGHLRRTYQTIDTNFSSYDRTDPFNAFNILLKLLGSLTSRIGGCQYKLSPEEHKLSVHLLTIIEPFVSLAPSRRTITRQPTEILDAIAFHVDSKHDLLSFALSCRRMHGVIFPRHFDYRVIRCKVSSLRIWNNLIVHRSLAQNVRKLEILDERSTSPETIPPGILTSDTDLESTDDELTLHAKQERFLVSALTKMTALQSFSWSCNHSPIVIDNVWPTLLKCHSLREIEINDNLIFTPHSTNEDESRAMKALQPRLSLFELKTVTLRSTKHVYGSTKNPALSRISSMLHNCPNLQSLDIAYTQPRSSQGGSSWPPADEFFMYSRWPHLRSLALSNLRCSPTNGLDAAFIFLGAHSNLQTLHLDIGAIPANVGGARLILPRNSLPCLRELQSHKDVAAAILDCECDPPRPLETIKGVRLSGSCINSDQDQLFLQGLKQCGTGIKRIELAGWNEMEDVKQLVDHAPGMTWLNIGKRSSAGAGHGVREKGASAAPTTNTTEWASLLSALPELTTFHGVRFFYEVSPQAVGIASSTPSLTALASLTATDRSRVRKNDEIASVLAWKCAKLRRVDYWEEGVGKIIVLIRDGEKEKDKVKWEVRRVK